MRRLLVLAVVGMLAGACSPPERQWMKIGETYTTEEFRRDYVACTRRAQLDEACMRSRGWIAVTGKPEKPTGPERPGSTPGSTPQGPTRY